MVLCSNRIDNGRLQTAVVFMPGGLYQNRIYLRVLTGIGIDSGENLTSLPLAICIKNPQNERVYSVLRNISKLSALSICRPCPLAEHFETIWPLWRPCPLAEHYETICSLNPQALPSSGTFCNYLRPCPVAEHSETIPSSLSEDPAF